MQTPAQLESDIRAVVRGAKNAAQAEKRIKVACRLVMVWVQERGPLHWGVLFQPQPGADNISIICAR